MSGEKAVPKASRSSFEIAAPPASSMIESLRGVGYSLETAIADLIDNSISARARNLWITFWWEGHRSYIAVLDDGDGMTEGELSEAMRPGSRSPLEGRSAEDLGRFGLGLKAASFSQCRQLTVASMRNAQVAIRRWDLDHVACVQEWQILKEPVTGSEEMLKPLHGLDQGTMVLWEDLDRVVGNVPISDSGSHDHFLSLIDRVGSHLAMVFHRFLEGGVGRVVDIHKRKRRRPSLESVGPLHEGPQCDNFDAGGTDNNPLRRCGGPGICPAAQGSPETQSIRECSGLGGWTAKQGFHVYRNRRMLVSVIFSPLGCQILGDKTSYQAALISNTAGA